MFLLLFSLIQSQQPPRLSPFVIAVAVLAFLLGVSLLVYFFRRLKTSEKEIEEDWSLSRRSLFVSPESVEQNAEQSREEAGAAGRAEPMTVDQTSDGELASIRTGEIHEAKSEQIAHEPRATQGLESEYSPTLEMRSPEAPTIREAQPSHRRSEPEPPRQERPTEVLASPQVEPFAQAEPIAQTERFSREAEAIDEAAPFDAAPFDDEEWAGVEINEQPGAPPAPPAAPDQVTRLLGSNDLWPNVQRPSTEHVDEQQAQPPVKTAEPLRDARVEQRTGRETFELPRISKREPFEPPIIKPLTPREQSTFMENQKDSSPSDDLYASSPRDKKGAANDHIIYGANIERQTSQSERRSAEPLSDAKPLYEDGPRKVEPAAPSIMHSTPADGSVEPSVAARQVEHAGGRNSSARSILGLPAEASRGPLILGEPARSKEEAGIGALSNYGRPVERDGGRGGTVALLAVILIIGGGLLAYFLIPSVHSGVKSWVARVRGTDVEEARKAAMTPKAVIYPRINSEVNKNQVKIKGAVENMWNEPLENLSVEVSLQRGGDAPPQVMTVTVNPSPLPPNQRGTFDFEYDGKRDTGFTGYKITKLLSNGNEIRYTSPNAQK